MQDIQRHKLSMGTLESIALPERGPRIDELSRELEAIYRRGVRIVHPDRVVSASEAVRQQADSLCRALNQWHEAQKNTLELLRTHQRLIDVTVEPGIPMGGLSEEDNARLIFKQLNSKIWYVLFRQSCNNPRYQAWSEQRWMRLHDGILEVQREVRERVAAMAAYRAENRAALAENQAILDAQGERIAQLMQQFELLADRVPAPATVAASPGTAPSAFFGGAGAAVAAVAAPTTTAISEGKSDDTGSAASAHTGV